MKREICYLHYSLWRGKRQNTFQFKQIECTKWAASEEISFFVGKNASFLWNWQRRSAHFSWNFIEDLWDVYNVCVCVVGEYEWHIKFIATTNSNWLVSLRFCIHANHMNVDSKKNEEINRHKCHTHNTALYTIICIYLLSRKECDFVVVSIS